MLLGAILFGLYVFGAVMISRYGALYRDFGWVVARRDGKWVVANVTPHGPAEGKLQVGDVFLAITEDHPRIAPPPRVQRGVNHVQAVCLRR